MKKWPLLLTISLFACQSTKDIAELEPERIQPIDWVNPFIGTGGHGHTYPGASTPFGFVQLSPDSRLDGWDGCGGYHYTDSIIYGFSHTHLQGTGISDYADILVVPTNNEIKKADNWPGRYSSVFKKESEYASPGYYQVHLDDHRVTAQLTATPRVGIHKYTYDGTGDSCVIFMDMAHRDELLEYSFYPLDDTTIVGHRVSKEWAEEQHIYFAAVFDRPFIYNDQTYETRYETNIFSGETEEIIEYVPLFPLDFKWQKELNMKVAISASSVQSALENLKVEAPHWNFDQYRLEAEKMWNDELSKIEISGGTEDERTNFYTGLYHSFTTPNNYSDVNHIYRGMDHKLYIDETVDRYTVFSLWDTFRATHPLFTLTQEQKTRDFMNGFIAMYEEGGQLPMWELANNYTGCMIGYHSVSALADAYIKGTWEPQDVDLMLEAMVQAADSAHLGKSEFAELGYLPSELEHESVSKTLEYAYNDFCIAQCAKKAGDMELHERFINRALNYRNIYDPESGFFRPKLGGGWVENYDPREVNFNYTEANGWQYNFFVPQDVNGHIELLGGDQGFEAKLDSLFFGDGTITGRDQADITGLIGQYAHGNEPSHHMAWLYHYIGKPDKSQWLVDSILSTQYRNAPDGLSGNEDCGQMSSWYVLASLGLYPVTPGTDEYVLGAPLFDAFTIRLENGNTWSVEVEKRNPDSRYIQSITIDGVSHLNSFIDHARIMSGGKMKMLLVDESVGFGSEMAHRPVREIKSDGFLPVPVVDAPRAYRGSTTISMDCLNPKAQILFKINHGEWQVYSEPFLIEQDVIIEAKSVLEALESATVKSSSRRITHNYKINLLTEYSNQYHAGGDQALIDGIEGYPNFKTGEWQGYYGKDIDLIIDLGEIQTVDSLSVGCLQDTKPWILYPKQVEVWTSLDGQSWAAFGSVENDVDPKDYEVQIQNLLVRGQVKARYIKLKVANPGKLPDWHLGAGYDSWVFLDEVQIW